MDTDKPERIITGKTEYCTFKEFIEHLTGVPFKEIYNDDNEEKEHHD